MTTFEIIVCPNCQQYELPSGCFRNRCPGCNTYFSRDDKRPEYHQRDSKHWKRIQQRFPKPGLRIEVMPIANDGKRRYLEKDCSSCGTRVEIPIYERRGDVAIDRLDRIEKLVGSAFNYREFAGRPGNGTHGQILYQVTKIIAGRA